MMEPIEPFEGWFDGTCPSNPRGAYEAALVTILRMSGYEAEANFIDKKMRHSKSYVQQINSVMHDVQTVKRNTERRMQMELGDEYQRLIENRRIINGV